MSEPSKSRRNFLRQLSCTMCAGGASALIPQLNLISSALAQGTVPGYRALVCVYLAGGNDAWNMVVPYDQARYDIYRTSRSGTYDATNNPGGLALARPGNTNMNIANGTEHNHEPTERVSAYALNAMLDITFTLIDEAAAA
jgi:uncharacterized protein (DUF1501 family)